MFKWQFATFFRDGWNLFAWECGEDENPSRGGEKFMIRIFGWALWSKKRAEVIDTGWVSHGLFSGLLRKICRLEESKSNHRHRDDRYNDGNRHTLTYIHTRWARRGRRARDGDHNKTDNNVSWYSGGTCMLSVSGNSRHHVRDENTAWLLLTIMITTMTLLACLFSSHDDNVLIWRKACPHVNKRSRTTKPFGKILGNSYDDVLRILVEKFREFNCRFA